MSHTFVTSPLPNVLGTSGRYASTTAHTAHRDNFTSVDNMNSFTVNLEANIVPLEECKQEARSRCPSRQSRSSDSTTLEQNSKTNTLFPPLPRYGPPSFLRRVQNTAYVATSSVLSFSFLMMIVAASMVQSVSKSFRRKQPRPHLQREQALAAKRRSGKKAELKHDLGYYAELVGLKIEEFKVITEDGFVLVMHRVFDPEYEKTARVKKYPVLLVHGLMQSAGAFCSHDDQSLAFYLCKSGYDVYLGNNRCYFQPEHLTYDVRDPRMWCWNIKQMGIYDLSAFINAVIERTEFSQTALVAHSQGTAETFVALARDQRPDLGKQISVFCALAPAVYSGPLIDRFYFKFIRLMPPFVFRVMFGIHSFIPFMLTMHNIVPNQLYGWLGYQVFSWLFGWSDTRWDLGLRSRGFMFAPVYVSAESMRWWLGRDGFATQRCLLATKEEVIEEARYDAEKSYRDRWTAPSSSSSSSASAADSEEGRRSEIAQTETEKSSSAKKDSSFQCRSWFPSTFPPLALWIAGADDLVDGYKLLNRLTSGREPHVNLVHSKVIDEYEHLDVIWAIDSIEQVGSEVKQVIWKTIKHENTKDYELKIPEGCYDIEQGHTKLFT